MAFDLSTAVPVENQKPKFDLSTAKPVDSIPEPQESGFVEGLKGAGREALGAAKGLAGFVPIVGGAVKAPLSVIEQASTGKQPEREISVGGPFGGATLKQAEAAEQQMAPLADASISGVASAVFSNLVNDLSNTVSGIFNAPKTPEEQVAFGESAANVVGIAKLATDFPDYVRSALRRYSATKPAADKVMDRLKKTAAELREKAKDLKTQQRANISSQFAMLVKDADETHKRAVAEANSSAEAKTNLAQESADKEANLAKLNADTKITQTAVQVRRDVKRQKAQREKAEKGVTTNEQDAKDSLESSQLPSRNPTYGKTLRADVAEENVKRLNEKEEKRKQFYGPYDEKLNQLDASGQPFAMTEPGQNFFKWLQSFRIVPEGAKTIPWSDSMKKKVTEVGKKLSGMSLPEKKSKILDESGKPVVTPASEIHRSGKVIDEVYRDLSDNEAHARSNDRPRDAKKWQDIRTKFADSIKNWVGEDVWPDSHFEEIYADANKMNTKSVEFTIGKEHLPYVPPQSLPWMHNWHEIPDHWFSGADKSEELKSVIGNEKWESHATQHAVEQIHDKTPEQINKWLQDPANAWVDQVHGLRDKISEFTKGLALRSARTDDLKEATKAATESIKASHGHLDKAFIEARKAAAAETKAAQEAAAAEARTAQKTLLSETKAAQEARLQARKGARKEGIRQIRSMQTSQQILAKEADRITSLLDGKTPQKALDNFDKHVVPVLEKQAGFTPEKINEVREELKNLQSITDAADKKAAMKKHIYYTLLGVIGAKEIGKVAAPFFGGNQ